MILAAVFGLFLGIASGLLPGIGSTSVMLVVLPLFLSMDPLHAFVAYLAIVISSQYVASVTAIYTGIPGAESASPTAKEFPRIRDLGLTAVAIAQNAKCSLLGNVVGLGLFALIVPYLFELAAIYQNNIKLGILALAYVALVLTSERKGQALGLIALGAGLMSLGYNEHTFETRNLGLSWLDSGLPWMPLILGSLIGASLHSLKAPNELAPLTLAAKAPYMASTARGSVIGFIVGFVPGLSYVLSSMLAYSYERRHLRASPEATRILGSIGASEAAQSSGSVSMLVPLLVFSIPITASEAVILNIVTLTTSIPELLTRLLADVWLLSAVLIGINVIGFVMALYSRGLVGLIFKLPFQWLKTALLCLGCVAVYFSSDYQLLLGVVVYALTLAGFAWRGANPLPFIMSVLLFSTTESTLYLFKDLL